MVSPGFRAAPQIAAFTASGGYYQAPKIPWQYTFNAGAFYTFQNYTVKFEIYNLDQPA